jgi:thiamine pyrophosphate-dependent acetolactate synthase large subunit-like protein
VLDQLAALLNGESRVTMLCGSGCQGAHDQLIRLAERLKAPIVHALKGKEHVEWENPYDVGMTGLIGFSSGYYAMCDCDILLMLGTDFPYRQFYPRGAGVRIAQVDLRAEIIGRRAPVDIGVVGEVRATVEALLRRSVTASTSIRRLNIIARRARASMILRPAGMASHRYTRSKLRRRSAIVLLMMRSLPVMWACRRFGPLAIWQ